MILVFTDVSESEKARGDTGRPVTEMDGVGEMLDEENETGREFHCDAVKVRLCPNVCHINARQ